MIQDLQSLKAMLVESGAGSEADIARAREESHGLGLFIRSLVGLDREAATAAFKQYLADTTLGQPAPLRPAHRRAPDGQRCDGGGQAVRVAVHR